MAVSFECSACGNEYEGEVVSRGSSDCRVCFRIGCDECLDERGNCVPCEKESQTGRA